MLVLVLFLPGILGATTINFDYWPDGTPIDAPTNPPYLSITDEFAEWGIIFESTTKILKHGTPSDLDTPPNCLNADDGDELGEDSITLDARFVCPGDPSLQGTVPWVQFFQDRGAQSGGGTFIAYDIDGNEVIKEPFNTSGKTFHWEYAGGIHRIYIGLCYDGVDDLTYGDITCVPEPAEEWIAFNSNRDGDVDIWAISVPMAILIVSGRYQTCQAENPGQNGHLIRPKSCIPAQRMPKYGCTIGLLALTPRYTMPTTTEGRTWGPIMFANLPGLRMAAKSFSERTQATRALTLR